MLLSNGCVGAKPVGNVHDLPLPAEVIAVRDYDAAHGTSYETFLKQVLLSMASVINTSVNPSAEFFVLANGRSHEGELWEFYEQELTPLDWQRDEDKGEVLMGLVDHFKRRSSRGEQRFVVTYLAVPDTRDLLMVRLLYPVW
jgi:hypothetical protein